MNDIEILEDIKEFLLSTQHEPQFNINQYTDTIENILKERQADKEKIKELEGENKELNIIRLNLLLGQFPDTTETYKKYKKELEELLESN